MEWNAGQNVISDNERPPNEQCLQLKTFTTWVINGVGTKRETRKRDQNFESLSGSAIRDLPASPASLVVSLRDWPSRFESRTQLYRTGLEVLRK